MASGSPEQGTLGGLRPGDSFKLYETTYSTRSFLVHSTDGPIDLKVPALLDPNSDLSYLRPIGGYVLVAELLKRRRYEHMLPVETLVRKL